MEKWNIIKIIKLLWGSRFRNIIMNQAFSRVGTPQNKLRTIIMFGFKSHLDFSFLNSGISFNHLIYSSSYAIQLYMVYLYKSKYIRKHMWNVSFNGAIQFIIIIVAQHFWTNRRNYMLLVHILSLITEAWYYISTILTS